MSIRVYAVDESAPPPRQIVAEVVCDGDHGLFPVKVGIEGAHWWPDVHAALMADGWSYRPATPEDIVEGNVIWYPHYDPDVSQWNYVVEVRHYVANTPTAGT